MYYAVVPLEYSCIQLYAAADSIALDINERGPRIEPARRARAQNTLFTDFLQDLAAHLTPLRRTSEFR
jgi:hypothetical protein